MFLYFKYAGVLSGGTLKSTRDQYLTYPLLMGSDRFTVGSFLIFFVRDLVCAHCCHGQGSSDSPFWIVKFILWIFPNKVISVLYSRSDLWRIQKGLSPILFLDFPSWTKVPCIRTRAFFFSDYKYPYVYISLVFIEDNLFFISPCVSSAFYNGYYS